MRRRLLGLGCAAAAAGVFGAGAAAAHMPYLLPSSFEIGRRDHVTLQATFTEEPFTPDVVLKSNAFFVRGPDGKDTPLTGPVYVRDLAVLESATPQEGTYRFSTGARQGRVGKMFRQDGQWEMVGEDADTAPAGAQVVAVQSITTAEAFVTKGRPSTAALDIRGRGLELRPLTHPADLAAGEAARFQLMLDGKPLPRAVVRLYRANGQFDGRKVAGEATTGADGGFTLTPPDAGRYLTLVRHRTEAPAGAATPFRSYTHTLAFEAAE